MTNKMDLTFLSNTSVKVLFLLFRGLAAPLLLVPFCMPIYSQSGRRASKVPTTSPAPATTVSNNEQSKPVIDQTLAVKAKLLVAVQHTNKKLPTEDAIFASFAKRLAEFADVSAMTIGELKTDQAAKRAQQETDSFVVVVQFQIDVYQNGGLVLNSQNLQVSCYAYAPKTGERIVKDMTYYQAVGGMGTRTPGSAGGTPLKITPEAAGISVAEQLHNGLILNARPASSRLP